MAAAVVVLGWVGEVRFEGVAAERGLDGEREEAVEEAGVGYCAACVVDLGVCGVWGLVPEIVVLSSKMDSGRLTSNRLPSASDLAFGVDAPPVIQLLGNIGVDELRDGVAHVAFKPRSEDNDIGVNLRAIRKSQPRSREERVTIFRGLDLDLFRRIPSISEFNHNSEVQRIESSEG